jgi:hypothetical protein
MTHFAVFDPATGAIRRHGSCMRADLARQAGEGEGVIATDGPTPGDRYVVDVMHSPPMPVPKATAKATR